MCRQGRNIFFLRLTLIWANGMASVLSEFQKTRTRVIGDREVGFTSRETKFSFKLVGNPNLVPRALFSYLGVDVKEKSPGK